MKTFYRVLIIFVLILSTGSFSVRGLSIVTGNPDFKIKVTRCEASGKTVVIDMIWENASSKDVKISVSPLSSYAYDDEGNKFGNDQMRLQWGNGGLSTGVDELLPAEIPIKVRLQIEGVPVSSTMLKRVDIKVWCGNWGFNGDKYVKITDIPITHEGD